MKCLDDFKLQLGKTLFKPIFIGGMGVDISSEQLALAGAKHCLYSIQFTKIHDPLPEKDFSPLLFEHRV